MNKFARRFTGVVTTIVIILVVITLAIRVLRTGMSNKLVKDLMHPMRVHLVQNEFSFDDLKLTYARAGGNRFSTGRSHTITFVITNVKHPELGSAPTVAVDAVIIDYADGNYSLQDFSITYPEHMKVEGWYYGPRRS